MKRKNENLIIAALLATAVMQMGTNGISPILADLAEAFPQAGDSTIQFLMTFPSLMVIIFGLAAGNASQFVPKKWLIFTGSCLFCLGGVLAWLFHGSLPILFLWGGLIGAGIGLAVPVNMGLITEIITPSRQATVMGMASSFANLGSMLMTLIGGYLALIHWSCGYLVYLIAVPAVILSLMVLPVRTAPAERTEEAAPKGGMLSLLKEPGVLGPLAIAFCSTLLFNTTPTNLSMQVAELGVGTSAQAGTGLSLMLLSGAVSCMFYGKISGKLGNYILTLGFGMMCLGQLIIAAAPNIWVIYLGCLIAGASHGNNMAHCLMVGAAHAKGRSGLEASMQTAVSNVGAFCTPVLTMLAAALSGGSSTAPRFFLGAACAGVIALGIGLVNRARHAKAA